MTCVNGCPTECSWIFSDLHVKPLSRGGTRVEWMIHPHFNDPTPYSFELQFGRTENPNADDWTTIAGPLTDVYFADDAQQRLFGLQMFSFYRVKLSTIRGTYYSAPQSALGGWEKADTIKVKNLLWQTELRLKQAAGSEGYLLKRRLYGEKCTCVDVQTDECRDPDCVNCYGTGIVSGYFDPYPCFYVEFTKKRFRSHVSDTGTQADGVVENVRMLNTPTIHSYDVWVDRGSDTRWFVHNVESEVDIRGIPIILFPVQLRMAPYTHVIYRLPIEGQQG
jgi:hypothetical protein